MFRGEIKLPIEEKVQVVNDKNREINLKKGAEKF